MSRFRSEGRSVGVYLNDIERYYKSMKAAKDFDHYCHYLTLMKNQIEFLSQYIVEENNFEEFKKEVYLTEIDKGMIDSIINTVELNLKFIKQSLAYASRLTADRKKYKPIFDKFTEPSGYSGEIRVGKPGRTRVNRDGTSVHFIDEATWNNIREQIGISENAVKDNSMYDVLGKLRSEPLSLNPDHVVNRSINKGEKINDN